MGILGNVVSLISKVHEAHTERKAQEAKARRDANDRQRRQKEVEEERRVAHDTAYYAQQRAREAEEERLVRAIVAKIGSGPPPEYMVQALVESREYEIYNEQLGGGFVQRAQLWADAAHPRQALITELVANANFSLACAEICKS